MCYSGLCRFENSAGECCPFDHEYEIAKEVSTEYGVSVCDIGGKIIDENYVEEAKAEFIERLQSTSLLKKEG